MNPKRPMSRERLAAFSDGVIAIIITIMVLELKVPHGDDLAALGRLATVFLSYVLSYVYVAAYWVNHHHLLHTVERVSGRILWANMHLLFWMSLIPLATGWLDESRLAPLPTAVYGAVLLMSALSYYLLQAVIVRDHGSEGLLAQALGSDMKGKLSLCLYGVAIGLAGFQPMGALVIYVVVALMWLLPDRRIERAVG